MRAWCEVLWAVINSRIPVSDSVCSAGRFETRRKIRVGGIGSTGQDRTGVIVMAHCYKQKSGCHRRSVWWDILSLLSLHLWWNTAGLLENARKPWNVGLAVQHHRLQVASEWGEMKRKNSASATKDGKTLLTGFWGCHKVYDCHLPPLISTLSCYCY